MWQTFRTPKHLLDNTSMWNFPELDLTYAKWVVILLRRELNSLPVVNKYCKTFEVDKQIGTNFLASDVNALLYLMWKEPGVSDCLTSINDRVLFAQLVYLWVKSTPSARLLVSRFLWKKAPWDEQIWVSSFHSEVTNSIFKLMTKYKLWLDTPKAYGHRAHLKSKLISTEKPHSKEND